MEEFIPISQVRCWSDSEVALYWTCGEDRAWKQFVQNKVCEIRSLVPPNAWSHCSSKDNPADIASRGTSPAILAESTWVSGPDWLKSYEGAIQISEEAAEVKQAPVESLQEAKKEHRELASNLPCSSLLTGSSSHLTGSDDDCPFPGKTDGMLEELSLPREGRWYVRG